MAAYGVPDVAPYFVQILAFSEYGVTEGACRVPALRGLLDQEDYLLIQSSSLPDLEFSLCQGDLLPRIPRWALEGLTANIPYVDAGFN